MTNLSEHITMAEATHTSTGLPNNPSTEQLKAMKYLADNLLEPLRAYIGAPIKINSFFRGPAVNAKIGGVATSQHSKGMAADIVCPGIPNKVLFDTIRERYLFDQLILEPSWVHVSLINGANRKQCLQAKKVGGKMVYSAI